jgi:hypothetical protein
MTPEEYIFSQYRGKRILLDSNLLLLFLIGSFERRRIEQFKRTSDFSEADFDILANLLTAFRTIVTTPHVLTEVSNLANALPENLKPLWAEHFALQTGSLMEVFEPAAEVMRQLSFGAFGLTDAAIHGAAQDTLILTEDFRLSGFLRFQGVAVLNFRDLISLSPMV